jgi:serine/threonine-protein kinase
VYLYESKDGKKLARKIFESKNTARQEKIIQKDLYHMGFSRIPKQLDHPSMSDIVTVFAEYSIEEYLNIRGIHNKLSFTDMLVQMVDAVKEMHSHGFIHQNIKPENFRIMNNRVVLIDFGLAYKYLEPDGRYKNLWNREIEGTPFYWSVKALQGYSQGPGSDISSVGFCILKLINPEISQIPWASLK